ncbi:MAG TPA: hypothetical protein VI756_13005 [Blastocatellia bacterium]
MRLSRRKKSNQLWAVISGAAIAAVAVAVVANLPDIKRYIKISTM